MKIYTNENLKETYDPQDKASNIVQLKKHCYS